MMKFKLIIMILFINLYGFAQVIPDTILLTGDARHYGDSVVLRWNTLSAPNYIDLLMSTLVIERRSDLEETFTEIARLNANTPEAWGLVKNQVSQAEVIAAAGIIKMKEISALPAASIEIMQDRYTDLQFLWANLSLYADLNPGVANLTHLRFCDKNLPKSNRLEYRLYAISNHYISDTLTYLIEGKGFENEYPGDFSAAEQEGSVRFEIPANRKYSAYYIQRKEESESWMDLNTAPLIIPADQGSRPMLNWVDSVVNYKAHEYRIYAVDMFGDRSKYSSTLTAMGRDLTPPDLLKGMSIIETPDKYLNIKWQKPKMNKGEKGIQIWMKESSDEEPKVVTEKMLSPEIEQYKFRYLKDQTDYFIQLRLYDTAGNFSITEAFYQLFDSIGPGQPQDLTAKVDSNGIVQLRWKGNSEKDLKGYLVFFANSEKAEMSGIVNQPISDTLFQDTLSLKMLNKDVFYQIMAVDFRFNQSPMSQKIRVVRPDKLPPVSPLIKSYIVSDTGILLKWIPSSSIDVAKHTLWRKHFGSDKIQQIQLQTDSIYVDKHITPGETYSYSFTATDSSGNISPMSNSVSLKTYKQYYLPPVKLFTALYSEKDNAVQLAWDYKSDNISKILIFKGVSPTNVSPMPLKVTGGQSVIDHNIKTGTTYYYAIRIFMKDGSQTVLSAPVAVYAGIINQD